MTNNRVVALKSKQNLLREVEMKCKFVAKRKV